MRWLLFLARVSFICGLTFLFIISEMIFSWMGTNAVASTIIIIGYFLGFICVVLSNIATLVVFGIRRRVSDLVPKWLIIANLALLVILITFIFYINDPYYHQT